MSTASDKDMFKHLDEVTTSINAAQDKLVEFLAILEGKRQFMADAIEDSAEMVRWSRFRKEYLTAFVEEPYVIQPSRLNKSGQVLEWRVFVPKFVEFHVGRLERATHSYNVFSVNQYMRWFAEIPAELADRFPDIPIKVQVRDGMLLTEETGEMDTTWGKYKEFLLKREGPGVLRIRKGSEWELIAKLLEDGGLPFVPNPVDADHFRDKSKPGFAAGRFKEMRGYQERALGLFKEYGAVGIYWPFGAGKSEFGIELCDILKGPKLIIAGSYSALRDQWRERLQGLPRLRREECHVVLYQSKKEITRIMRAKKIKKWRLIIFDECHHLPAKTFMWMSSMATDYRLGLTGSPYREDGHINYIIALSGMPDGLAWAEFVASGIITLAQVQIHVVTKARHKRVILNELLKREIGKTLIYSDSLDLGQEVADEHGLEFYRGGEKDVVNKVIASLEEKGRVVVSRVGDEGISVKSLDTVIEIDFLGGSRAQALQRVGRLQHRRISADQEPAVHHVLITEEEVQKYGKRLLAYYDKGYKVDWLYNY